MLRMVSAKKIRPAFTMPFFENSIDSDGSSGDMVVPVASHCAMWMAIRT